MILLVKPRGFSLTSSPPLGLGYLAAALAEKGFAARIVDLSLSGQTGVWEKALMLEPIDWIGFSVSSQNLSHAKKLVSLARAVRPGVPLVIGGTYPTTLPELALTELTVDAAVLGEGERTVVELAAALAGGRDLSTVAGIIFRRGDEVVRTDPRPYEKDLDTLPIPDHAQIPPSSYSAVPWQIVKRGKTVGAILTSRGCPYGCSFCAAGSIMGRSWRRRSLSLVGEEMAMLHRRFGVNEFHVMDDNLAGTRDHLRGFCEEILRRGLDIHWKTPNGVRSDHLDDDTLALLRRSGCYMLGFGIESADKRILKGVAKGTDPAFIRERVRAAKRHGIITFGYFIIGLPGDTTESMNRSIAYSVSSGLDLAHFSYFVPYPGSAAYAGLSPESRARVRDRMWNFLPWERPELPASLQRRTNRKAHAAFYLRPKTIRLFLGFLDFSNILPFFRAGLSFARGKNSALSGASDVLPGTRLAALAASALMLTARRMLEGGFGADESLVKRLAALHPGRVLDAGCGEGALAASIPAGRYLGVDKSAFRLAAARLRKPDHAFLKADLTGNDLMDGRFSLVILSKTLHHMTDAEARLAIARAGRLLEKSGAILVLEPEAPQDTKNLFHRLVCRMETGRHHRGHKAIASLLPEDLVVTRHGRYKAFPMLFNYAVIMAR